MNILEKIKNLVFVDQNQEFMEADLEDGRMIKTSTESMEVGTSVFVVMEDGSEGLLDAGTYKLSDGTEFVVDELGIVTEILGMEESEEVAEGEDSTEEEMEAGDVVKSAEVVQEVSELVDEITPEAVSAEDSAVISEAVTELISEKIKEVEEVMASKFEDLKALMLEMAKEQEKSNLEFEAFKKSPSDKAISELEFHAEGEKLSAMEDRIARIKAMRASKN